MEANPFEWETRLALRAAVRSILEHPLEHTWSLQGFGMLRTYFGNDPDQTWRLNLWDSHFAVPGVSVIHDHPWDFTSWVIAGQFVNRRFYTDVSEYGEPFHWMTIRTGEGGGPDGPEGTVWLSPSKPEVLKPGDIYYQSAEEIHYSDYVDGTVTLNKRTRRLDGEHARVFWTFGKKWVDAKPRNACQSEVVEATQRALAHFQ